MLQTEFEFTLPKGYVDGEGNLHRDGTMRLATALDEVVPMRDPRVKSNDAYLTIILLSRVVTQLGTLRSVTPDVIGNLYSADFNYLQDFYWRINENGHTMHEVTCPECQNRFQWEEVPSGE